jgi:hypothetical protein
MNARAAAQVSYSAGLVPRIYTDRWAVLAGVTGLAANLLLISFFVLAPPWRQPFTGLAWLGPANDAVVVVQFAALVPVAVAVRARLGQGRLVRGATVVAVVAMGSVVVLQVLLLADVLGFQVQGPLVVACFLVIFGWLLAVSRIARRTGALPGRVVRCGLTVSVSYLIGVLVVAAALLAPWGSSVQYAGFGVGVAVGLFGWLGFPVWSLLLARQVFKEDR